MARETALITGASSGLGIAFAEDLAKRGYNLILSARGAAAMETLASRLREQYGVDVAVQPADLSQPQGAAGLIAALDERGLSPSVVVNNAGIGLNDRFIDQHPDRLTAMLHLNILAVTELTRCYGQRMDAVGGGHILLVASLAAYMPAPLLAAYAASKAYVLSLGEALHVELAPKVGVTVLSPGYMNTGFDAASGFQPTPMTQRSALSPEKVAGIGLDTLFKGKSSVVAGTANTLAAAVAKVLPRDFIARQAYKTTGAQNDAS
ncbi:SDR family NAD(P)-dependent oxidoreductase [Sphingomonas sp. MMS24-J13]|uniref:SDR family NAD(P)-dependent oxidoreductase n=1 Tax=Sphingomonas sp. MMS24-J13 TaxID=3238686 RepID=UPI00384D0BF0